MTPKEKAEELFDKFNNPDRTNYLYYSHNAQQCALITVDEILKVVSFYNDSQAEVIYFKEVKQEIKKL
jgi:hypothetical protein